MIEPVNHIMSIVLNIQRFSIHDGPGIRTTVFLKGCSLKCKWCSNPESQTACPEIAINWNLCVGCNKCIDICPKANKIVNGKIIFLKDKCKVCGKCINFCSGGARKLYGRVMSLSEVFEEIEKDMPFYLNSGGGITVSGGEPFLQQQFLLFLLKASQSKLIHTAIETSGYFQWQKETDEILNYTDLVLFDLKLMDKEKHKTYMGKGNKLILRNLKKMVSKAKTTIRMPIIPKINDDDRSLNEMIKFIHGLEKIEEINLIPYHNLGEFKYEMLQKKYELTSCSKPSIERLQDIKNLFESNGIRTTIIN